MAGNYERLAELARRWIEQGWQQGNAAVVDELHAAGFIDRASAGRPPDSQGFKQGIVALYRAFPDFHAVVEDLVVDEARQAVAVRWTARGTHRGTYMGAPATGRVVQFAGIEIIRVEAGKITERWGEWDGLSLLEQLKREA